MDVTIHCIADSRKVTCSALVSGADLLRLFDRERLVLASVKPLKTGTLLRAYRGVQRDNEPVDLDQYREIYTSDRQFLAKVSRCPNPLLNGERACSPFAYEFGQKENSPQAA